MPIPPGTAGTALMTTSGGAGFERQALAAIHRDLDPHVITPGAVRMIADGIGVPVRVEVFPTACSRSEANPSG